MSFGTYKLIPESFDPIPSQAAAASVGVLVSSSIPAGLDALGFVVSPTDSVPDTIDLDWNSLQRSGFLGKKGQTLVLARPSGPVIVLVGSGGVGTRSSADARDLAATFARAAHRFARVGLIIGSTFDLAPETLGSALTEGVLLARYRYNELKPSSEHVALVALDLIVDEEIAGGARAGVHRGEVLARATNLARDLANTPPSHLTATDIGIVAERLGAEYGVEVDVFDKQQIIDLGCGGLLGVNAGSVEEPRMIKLVYTAPAGATPAPHLALVGKGIMYDSGGISLKPSDPMHLAMKMDMAGAGAVLAAMTTLSALDCPTSVTAWLMCTDNMPSGSAMKLGDVLTIRGGTTVEVKNTDAEGRLVMSDALVLASEENPDAIVDIATLTGAALMALGTHTAAVLGSSQPLVDQLLEASARVDESIWQLPLERRYRQQLDSHVADISNMAGKYAGSTTAALFLADFTGDIPWAHLDIAGTMQSETDDSWRPQGATGFGTRLLVDFALSFEVTG
ncbi:leucyl aminopeptidase [Agreia sp.]|uniref:leucyl aminopeptidase n=1 Tax=Agreia sp. TaxID=1872416 RepID=UPI0035BC4D8C